MSFVEVIDGEVNVETDEFFGDDIYYSSKDNNIRYCIPYWHIVEVWMQLP